MFRVPAGWIVIALFAFLTAVLFVNQTIIPGQTGSLRYFFAYSGWLLIPIAPAISMRLMSEEYRSGSFEALRTAPAGDWSVTLGKYFGSLAFLILMLVPTLVYPIVLMLVSDPSPDPGPIVAGYLMLVLVGMLYLGIGMVASSLTASQTLAFLGTVMTLILVMVLTSVIAMQVGVESGILLSTLSITDRVNELSKGIIDTAAVSFFLIGSAWMLVLAAGVLEVRRLGKSRHITIISVAVFIVATGTAAILAGSITNTYHYRVDVTSTGSHKLSGRATGIVDRLNDQTEIVLAIGMSRAEKPTIDLITDVLDAYGRSSELINVRTIDLDSAEGNKQIRQLLSDLADRDRESINSNMSDLRAASELMLEIAPALSDIATMLEAVRDAIAPTTQTNVNNRAVFEQRASIIRVYSNDILTQGKQIQSQIQAQSSSQDIFPFDTSAEPVERTLAQLMNQLDDLAAQVDAFASADELESEARSIAAPIIRHLESLRDRAAIAHDQINRLERIDALRVGRALETGEALLVIGPPEQGVAAVDLDEILYSTVSLERAGISAAGVIGPRAQELIASALAKLVAPAQPILVFVHGGKPNELLGSSELFTKTTQRLAEKGIDSLEWAAVEEPNAPDFDIIDPLGIRPVVYAVISVDSSAGSGDSGLTGAKRATEIGKIVERLIQEGESVMISLNPSIFSSFGDPDPIAKALIPFGLIPDSGRPLLHDKIGTLGRIADPITQVVPTNNVHPISKAMSGLSTVLPWAVPMSIEPIEGVDAISIVESPGDDETWAENKWLGLWSTPAQSRHLLRDQPIYDSQEDERAQSWTLAASAQRTNAGTLQRVIVVGSNGWATDSITAAGDQLVDGRVITKWPGNITLLDSSIAWLAGMDDLIGPGTQARPIATIKSLSESQLSMIRWILLAGLPGLILVLGMVSRLIFG
jgi:ABC-2 type transport system permease protein